MIFSRLSAEKISGGFDKLKGAWSSILIKISTVYMQIHEELTRGTGDSDVCNAFEGFMTNNFCIVEGVDKGSSQVPNFTVWPCLPLLTKDHLSGGGHAVLLP